MMRANEWHSLECAHDIAPKDNVQENDTGD
jgi:hypothetical protein